AFAKAVTACDAARAWQHALVLADVMMEQGHGKCLAGVHAQMMWCRSNGRWKRAVGLLEDMKPRELAPSSVTYALIIAACRLSKEWRWPLRLLAALTAERFPLDTRICGAAAGACHQVGHWRWAAWVLEQLWQSRGQGPSTEDISLNLALATCKEGRKWQQALHMLAEAGRLVWDDVAASSLIKALGPRWAISLAILDRAPGISARAAAIASCTQARQWKQSLALITGQIDAVALSSAVNSCAQSTEWQRALALGSSYANDWYQDGILWSSLLSACQHGSAWDVALELFGQMQHTTGMHPNSAVFGTLLRSCSSSYRWEEALQQAFSMKDHRLMPTAVCTSGILATLVAAGHADSMPRLSPAIRRLLSLALVTETWQPPVPHVPGASNVECVVLTELLEGWQWWSKPRSCAMARCFLTPLQAGLRAPELPACRGVLGATCTMGAALVRLQCEASHSAGTKAARKAERLRSTSWFEQLSQQRTAPFSIASFAKRHLPHQDVSHVYDSSPLSPETGLASDDAQFSQT
ncbi:MRL1, partial [Symbiodinium necroappetens]